MKLFKRAKETIIKAVPVGITPDWMTNNPQWSEFNGEKAVTEGYKQVAWVYACVKKRADALASVPLIVETKTLDGWQADPTSPLQELLDYPNPDISKTEFLKYIVMHLDLQGNFYAYKNRAGSKNATVELWPLIPYDVEVQAGRDRLISAYIYNNNGRHTYNQEDVLHAKYIDPSSLYIGIPPLMAAAKATDIDNAAAGFQKISMQNRGVPDGIFSFDAELTYEEWEEAKQQVTEQYANNANARAPWVLSKANYIKMGLTPAELDFMESRNFSMKQIAAVYGVPIEMIHGMGDANRASGENVRRTFWLETMIALLTDVENALTLSLVPDFGDVRTMRIKFDTSAVPALQENYTEKVNNAKGLWSMGVPFNDVNTRLELGFEEIEGGDVGYIPSGVIPASFDNVEEPQLPPAEEAEKAYGPNANRE